MSLRIGLLTSGGDTPGMNTAISAVSDRANSYGASTLGIRWGFAGLADRDMRLIGPSKARMHRARPGTWLGTSRWPAMRDPGGAALCAQALRDVHADGLIVLGGDGSLKAARCVAEHFAPVAFLPCTIDNDVDGTATTIGVDSAVAYAAEVIARLRCTGRALPGRGFIVQTLGGHTGHLAAAVAAATGIEDVLVPERPIDVERIASRLYDLAPAGSAIAVMSEGGIGDAVRIAGELTRLSRIRVHPTVLGHAQRAADPTPLDQHLAQLAATTAVDHIVRGESCYVSFDHAAGVVARPLAPLGAPTPTAAHDQLREPA